MGIAFIYQKNITQSKSHWLEEDNCCSFCLVSECQIKPRSQQQQKYHRQMVTDNKTDAAQIDNSIEGRSQGHAETAAITHSKSKKGSKWT